MPIKEKNLESEIETNIWIYTSLTFTFDQREESRVRDWNTSIAAATVVGVPAIKEKNLESEIETTQRLAIDP